MGLFAGSTLVLCLLTSSGGAWNRHQPVSTNATLDALRADDPAASDDATAGGRLILGLKISSRGARFRIGGEFSSTGSFWVEVPVGTLVSVVVKISRNTEGLAPSIPSEDGGDGP